MHAADNTKLSPSNKSTETVKVVRPLLLILNDRFLFCGIAFGSSAVSSDEAITPYYGRDPSKQFIRSKSIRRSYKASLLNRLCIFRRYCIPRKGPRCTRKFLQRYIPYGVGGYVVLNMLDKLECASLEYHKCKKM